MKNSTSNQIAVFLDVDGVINSLNHLYEDGDFHMSAPAKPYPTISHATFEERERRVFQACVEKGIPCVFVLAGGYTFSQDMTSLVTSHVKSIQNNNNIIQSCSLKAL